MRGETCSFATLFQSVEITLPLGRAQRGNVNRNRNLFISAEVILARAFASPSSGQKPNQQFAEVPEEIWIPVPMEMHCSWILGLCGCGSGSLWFSEQDLGFYPRVSPQGLWREQHVGCCKAQAGWMDQHIRGNAEQCPGMQISIISTRMWNNAH